MYGDTMSRILASSALDLRPLPGIAPPLPAIVFVLFIQLER
jgi:hypothetical protein